MTVTLNVRSGSSEFSSGNVSETRPEFAAEPFCVSREERGAWSVMMSSVLAAALAKLFAFAGTLCLFPEDCTGAVFS